LEKVNNLFLVKSLVSIAGKAALDSTIKKRNSSPIPAINIVHPKVDGIEEEPMIITTRAMAYIMDPLRFILLG